MKKLLYKCRFLETPDGFIVSGKLMHWTVMLPVLFWGTLGVPILFNEGFMAGIKIASIYLILAVLLTLILLYILNFQIQVDSSRVVVRFRIWIIPFQVMRSRLSDLIIDHTDAEGLDIISPRKDYYKEDVKNNLRFSYIVPWDVNYHIFYIDFKGKETDFDTYSYEFVWTSVINGLKKMQQKILAA